MEYIEKYKELKDLFSDERPVTVIPGSGVRIMNARFESGGELDDYLNRNDLMVPENRSFTYPVFVPACSSRKVILLFHGLNERSWLKYLSWAFCLAEYTGSYVVLFPISFHINRSPSEWKDPRAMTPVLKQRQVAAGGPSMSSFANVALSNRLSEDPLRFFFSGYRTVLDVTNLARSVRKGEHPFIPAGSTIDIFGYSIGAFMAEIIMMGNPEGLFEESKLFMFCGGSVFSSMHGTSKLIMDSRAFDRIYTYYLNDFEETITRKNPLFGFFTSGRLGMSFRSMIDFSRLRSFRDSIFRKLRDQVCSISLAGDTVIPAAAVVETLNTPSGKNIAEVWDFPYLYSHENPFPGVADRNAGLINSCFDKVFTRAAEFLV